MDSQDTATAVQRTVLSPETTEGPSVWVTPVKCAGCESRVSCFMRATPSMDYYTEFICDGCGSAWENSP
jgi:ribosomal protein S27E